MNELELGVPLKAAMSSIFRQKLTPQVYREMVLEAKRYSGKDALENGIVDWLGGIEEVLKIVGERKLTEKAKIGVYGKLKKEMWRETLGYLGPEGFESEEIRVEVEWEKDDEEKAEGRRRVEEWKRNATKAKL